MLKVWPGLTLSAMLWRLRQKKDDNLNPRPSRGIPPHQLFHSNPIARHLAGVGGGMRQKYLLCPIQITRSCPIFQSPPMISSASFASLTESRSSPPLNVRLMETYSRRSSEAVGLQSLTRPISTELSVFALN